MTRLLLVRHARPAADWHESVDAPLDPVGVEQAHRVAERLAARGRLPLVTSPLRRARETAEPLASRWDIEARVVAAVGEIPSPVDDVDARGPWLSAVLERRWVDVDDDLRAWRARLLDTLTAFAEDTVVFTHYVAINTAVGAATGDDRLVSCTPGHASVTELALDRDGRLSVISLDDQPAGPQIDSPL